MAGVWNLSPQSNIEFKKKAFVIIVLCDPESTSNDGLHRKSGLTETSNNIKDSRIRQQIKKRLQSSTTLFSRILDPSLTMSENNQEDPQFFHEVEQCLEHIKSYKQNRFWLIISDRYALDQQLIAQFKELRQIVKISHSESEVYQKYLKEQPTTKEPLDVMKLPESLHTTPIENFDNSMKLLLIEHFLEELLIEGSDNDADWHGFLQYCQQRYKHKPHVIDEVKKWIAIYDTEEPIRWYSSSGHISFRLVSRVCGTADIKGVILLRHFLCDLYKALKILHDSQVNELQKKPLILRRGTKLNQAELSWLQNRGTLCLTRPFLSTTQVENIASAFSGETHDSDGKVPVIITMKIESQQIKDSLIADISGKSVSSLEKEFILARRLVFRVDSVQPSTESNQIIHIQLVRGFEEANIERILRNKYFRVAMGGSFSLLSLISLVSIKETPVSIVPQPRDVHTQQHYLTIDMENTQVSDIDNIKLTEDQALNSHPTPNSAEQIATQGELAANGNGATSGAVSAATGAKTWVLGMATKPIFLAISVTTVVVVVVASVVIPLAIILPNHNTTNKETTPVCSSSCVFKEFVDNPSSNYQAEQLNFTCTKTLTNMTLTIIVQRNYNETHAQQYETFWNHSTNRTYTVTPSEITYQWFSWFHMYIVANSFPHFVRVEYYYTPGFTRVTSNDTWLLSATTICNETKTYSGTF